MTRSVDNQLLAPGILVIGVAIGVVVLTAGAMGASGNTADDAESLSPAPDEPSFVVALDDEGAGTVTVTYVFDLDDDARETAFEELRDNETAKESFRDRFETRMETIAEDTAALVERDLSVSTAVIDLETVDGTGVAILSVTIENLAASDGTTLTLTEPFASGFEPDRPFYVQVPDEYEITSPDPTPTDQAATSAMWPAQTNLSGFELVAVTEDAAADTTDDEAVMDDSIENDDDGTTDDTADADDDGLGFGILATLGAACVMGLLAVHRRERHREG